MRVLITGASGLLGSYLMKTAPKGTEFNAERFDITSEVMVEEGFQGFHPDLVIHCAGEGQVDIVEAGPQVAADSIVIGTQNMLAEAMKCGSRFVYISSNAVFRGDAPPYSEYALQFPVNRYGALKSVAERLVHQYQHRWTIIRPILLYGWQGPGRRNNFVTRILEDLRAGAEVRVAVDIFSQPTYAGDCAEAIWVATRAKVDILNIAPREKMSLFKFAVEVAKAFDLDERLIIPVPASEFKSLAPRPRDTTFDVSKAEFGGLFLSRPSEGLQKMRRERE